MVNSTKAPNRHRARSPRILLALLLSLVIATTGCTARPDAQANGDVFQQAGSFDGSSSHDGESEEAAPSKNDSSAKPEAGKTSADQNFDYGTVPAYSGNPYAVINDNVPSLAADDADAVLAQSDSPANAEAFSPLDDLGRCGTAMAVVSPDTQPAEPRGSIGMVKPSGWHTVRYDDLVDGKYLYNRCHLIGYQLTGEGANELNLITGTRYMNTQGMLPFENWIDDCADSGGRVLLSVTPVFVDDELVARGVHMEALSLDDGGASVSFNVFCYNVQPGIDIDYATGDSRRARDGDGAASPSGCEQPGDYVLNTNTGKFHLPGCRSVTHMKPRNKQEVTMARSEILALGYEPCAQCNP